MVTIVRLITLTLEVLLQQFVNGVGILALMVALTVGFLRAPLWSILGLTVIFGFGVEYFEGWIRLSDKAESASERWFLMVEIYLIIAVVGYLIGYFSRRHLEQRKKKTATPTHR